MAQYEHAVQQQRPAAPRQPAMVDQNPQGEQVKRARTKRCIDPSEGETAAQTAMRLNHRMNKAYDEMRHLGKILSTAAD